jgi:type IV pilus assembly protein PilW
MKSQLLSSRMKDFDIRCSIPISTFRQNQGFTLIEIMIALLLGVFLLGGVIGIFISAKQTNREQDALSRLQENGRFAMEFLARDIRMADYRGCQTATPPSLDVTVNVANVPLTGTDGGVDATNSALDPPDTINVRWSENGCAAHSAPLDADGCPTDLNKECSQNRVYGVSASKALYQNTTGFEIVEGVENMQILYGVDSEITVADPDGDGVANYYLPGTVANFPAAVDWAKVVSVRISLLLQTIDDNIASRPLPYTYNGGTTTPADHRIRRIYNSTFALRNRIH